MSFVMLHFASFHQTLDAEMKRLKAGGLRVHTKQGEPITPDEEELLWSTLVYLCGMYFVLVSIKEHRNVKLALI